MTYSEILILAMLRVSPRHGYEIRKDIDKALGGMVVLNNKTLYGALKRFQLDRAVTRRVIHQTGKPDRHVYQLTELGTRVLRTSLRDFGPEQAKSDAEFFTRVAFFGFLEVPERRAILQQRLAYLDAALAYLQGLHHAPDEDERYAKVAPSRADAERVLGFQTKRVSDESRWVASWLEELKPRARTMASKSRLGAAPARRARSADRAKGGNTR